MNLILQIMKMPLQYLTAKDSGLIDYFITRNAKRL